MTDAADVVVIVKRLDPSGISTKTRVDVKNDMLPRIALTLAFACSFGGPAIAESICPGDCDGSTEVTVNELVQAVNIALGNGAVDGCSQADINGDLEVTIDELLSAVNALLNGCGLPTTATPTAAPPTPTATATATTSFDPQNPPTTSTALRTWLVAGVYKSWHAESDLHPSGGPHGGTVRTYLNDAAFESLSAGNAAHPRGTAVVKELYFNTQQVLNWAVEIKLEDDSDSGRNWYWWEGASLQGRGLGVCTGCHGNDYQSYRTKDFILTPFPLQ